MQYTQSSGILKQKLTNFVYKPLVKSNSATYHRVQSRTMKVQCVIFIVGFVVLAAAKPQGQSLQLRDLPTPLPGGNCSQCDPPITELLKSIDFKNLIPTVTSLGPFVAKVTRLVGKIAYHLLTNVNAQRDAIKSVLDTVESDIKPVLDDVKVALQKTIKCEILGDLIDHLGDNIKATVTAIKLNFDPLTDAIVADLLMPAIIVDLPSSIGKAVKSAQPEIVTLVEQLLTDLGGALEICDLPQKLGSIVGVVVSLLAEILVKILTGSKLDPKILGKLLATICLSSHLPVFPTLNLLICNLE